MTKRDHLSLGTSGPYVADFHQPVIDNDPVNESDHQCTTLSEREGIQRGSEALAERVAPLRYCAHSNVLLRLGCDLPEVPREAVLGLTQLLAFACPLLVRNHFGQVDFQQARWRPLQLGEGRAEGVLASLQRLREPSASLGTLQFLGNESGVRQDLTEIVPDEGIQGLRLHKPGCTSRPQRSAPRGSASPAPIVAVPRAACASCTGELALATTDQAPQERLMGGVRPTRTLASLRQTGLRGLERRRANQGRASNGQPVFGWRGPMAESRPYRAEGRVPGPGGDGETFAAVRDARIHRMTEDAAYASDMPARFAHGGRHV